MFKGLCKGSFKYISQIFVVKEREMEIGCPTDVKHVAHIGWDGRDGTTPSWMSEFDRVSDLTMESIGSFGGSKDQSWTSQDFERTFGRQSSSSAKLSNFAPTNLATDSKKSRRKKTQSTNLTPKRSSKISCKPRFMQRGSEEGDSMWSTVHL